MTTDNDALIEWEAMEGTEYHILKINGLTIGSYNDYPRMLYVFGKQYPCDTLEAAKSKAEELSSEWMKKANLTRTDPDTQLIATAEVDAMREEIRLLCDMKNELAKGEQSLRYMLWLSHYSHMPYLYGDDGERQCNKCGIDFKRDSIQKISEIFFKKENEVVEAAKRFIEGSE